VAREMQDVGDGVVVVGLQNSVLFVDGWSGLGLGQWKMASVAAYGEEGSSVERPW
jgi:hypothetical protein